VLVVNQHATVVFRENFVSPDDCSIFVPKLSAVDQHVGFLFAREEVRWGKKSCNKGLALLEITNPRTTQRNFFSDLLISVLGIIVEFEFSFYQCIIRTIYDSQFNCTVRTLSRLSEVDLTTKEILEKTG